MADRSFGDEPLPPEQQRALDRAIKVEWFGMAYLASTVVIVYLVMGSSQAMKVAWIEDLLSFIPPIAFLIAVRRAQRPPDPDFPYGHHRAVGAAHLAAAVSLLIMGGFLVQDSLMGLIRAEHPPIGTLYLFGHTIWSGWLMIGAMVYAAVGPIILGRLKMRLAEPLHDKVLYADADMNKADWMTAASAIVGVAGIGVGLWWLDAAAAIFISAGILHDGWKNLRNAVRGLLDARARTFDDGEVHPLVARVQEHVAAVPWVRYAGVRARDEGHVMHVEIFVVPQVDHALDVDELQRLRDEICGFDWKLQDVVIVPVPRVPETARQHEPITSEEPGADQDRGQSQARSAAP